MCSALACRKSALPAAARSHRRVETRALCCCRDPMYHALKSTLWDLFPAWEDLAVDAAFREMLWASRAGEPA